MIPNLSCPTCHKPITLDDVNVARDLALCRACRNTFSFADSQASASSTPFDPSNVPPGAWYEETPRGFRAGATTRSSAALFVVPFACVWSAILLGSLYGSQIASGKFSVFHTLFGVPFVIGTVVLGFMCLMMIAGRVVVGVEDDILSIFEGIGPIGWGRRVALSDVRDFDWTWSRSTLRPTAGAPSNRRQPTRCIQVIGPKTYLFGALLSEDRQCFLMDLLRNELRRLPIKSKVAADPDFS